MNLNKSETRPHDLPVGDTLHGWVSPASPSQEPLIGNYCKLERLNRKSDSQDLFKAYSLDETGRMWTYLPHGPFQSIEEFDRWIASIEGKSDPIFFSIKSPNGQPLGLISYMRINQADGIAEIGHVCFSPLLQKTRMATEAIFLMIDRLFGQGYRRCEWKCDAFHNGSRQAAIRFGFQYEGLFRQSRIYKGRTRDTTWFSIIDKDWDVLRPAYLEWLDPSNFHEDGSQIQSLKLMILKRGNVTTRDILQTVHGAPKTLRSEQLTCSVG